MNSARGVRIARAWEQRIGAIQFASRTENKSPSGIDVTGQVACANGSSATAAASCCPCSGPNPWLQADDAPVAIATGNPTAITIPRTFLFIFCAVCAVESLCPYISLDD
jgi:hypothetical protein